MTLVIAHRGASAYAPENTLAAFELAVEQRADMIEIDVQRSVDGELVVFHDDTTERWNGVATPVSSCSLAELRQLNIGGERVPTLAETVAFARKTGIALNVELKQADIGAQCIAILQDGDLLASTVISSFYEEALIELKRFAPRVQRGYLMGIRTWRPDIRVRETWPFFALRRVDATAWHPAWQLPNLELLAPLARRAGYAVNIWTVDDIALMQQLAVRCATGIITNRPDVAVQALQ
jgi:glycerophosphoryl diester phosphodiesterase